MVNHALCISACSLLCVASSTADPNDASIVVVLRKVQMRKYHLMNQLNFYFKTIVMKVGATGTEGIPYYYYSIAASTSLLSHPSTPQLVLLQLYQCCVEDSLVKRSNKQSASFVIRGSLNIQLH